MNLTIDASSTYFIQNFVTFSSSQDSWSPSLPGYPLHDDGFDLILDNFITPESELLFQIPFKNTKSFDVDISC